MERPMVECPQCAHIPPMGVGAEHHFRWCHVCWGHRTCPQEAADEFIRQQRKKKEEKTMKTVCKFNNPNAMDVSIWKKLRAQLDRIDISMCYPVAGLKKQINEVVRLVEGEFTSDETSP